MDSIQTLMGYGFPEHTARRMIASYESHIGEMHGCNKVTDVKYIYPGKRDIELTCIFCGAICHKTFNVNSKWSELRKTCSCQMKKYAGSGKKPAIRNDNPMYIGKVYGDFKVTGAFNIPHKTKSGSTVMWTCQCIHCGEVTPNAPSVIKRGKTCHCQLEVKWNAVWEAEIGKRYGRLTVVSIEHKISGKNKKPYAVCNCDCGGSITVQVAALRSGQTKSCGCLMDEFIKKARAGRKEARSRSPLYATWRGMLNRCENENAQGYKDYGGRGIRVCDEWHDKEGFDRFEKWSYDNGYAPEAGLSLDRIDVNGNYEPSNCRYTNVYIQTVNQRPAKRRNTKRYIVDGEEGTLNQLCKKFGISTVAVNYRINTMGMDLETALKTPKANKGNIYAGEQSRNRRNKEIHDLNKCNSYIEANLYLAFMRQGSRYILLPQYDIGNYRADFLVDGTSVVVECDGYDNHKTKEQIERDYKRERYFIKEGYTVVRFSGTEINRNPEECCKEILEILNAKSGNRQTNTG